MKSSMKSEFQLIDAFARRIRRKGVRAPGVVIGVGDDAAVLRPNAREDLVVTTDSLVEGVHFERRWFTGHELGWRLAAVNVSDIAAMGARPRYGLVSLVIPPGLGSSYVEGIERGVVDHLAKHGAAVVGGNIASTGGPLTLELTLIGACARGRAWRRRAHVGDAIVVAGALGAAAAGIALLRAKKTRGPLVRAYREPAPRLDAVRALANSRSVRGAIDVSDGFSSDVIHLCEASRVGCDVDAAALPIPRAVRAFCREHGLDPIQWALHAGEDYALILSVAPQRAAEVCRRIRQARCPAAVVGSFTGRRGAYRLLDARGKARSFEAGGWDHLRKR
jgi:thiamine-monophosphate kinase